MSPFLVGVALLGVATLFLRLRATHDINGADLDVYLRAGTVVLGDGDLYAVLPGVLPFTYSPFAALLFSPLAPLEPTTAYAVVTGLSLMAYAPSVFFVARSLNRSVWWAVAVGVFGLSLEPVFRTLTLGQVNLLLLFLVTADLFAVKPSWRGWLVGIAWGCKVIPGVFVLVFLVRRQWDAAVRAACGFVATVTIGAVAQPSASWEYWSGGFADLGRFGPASVPGADNQALVAVWARLTRDASVPVAITIALGLIALSLGVAAGWANRQDVPVLVACVALGGLLASPVSWTHHWVWCVPLLMFLLSRGPRWCALVVGLIFWLGPMWLVPRGSPALNPGEQLLAASYVIAAVLVWLATGRPSALPQPRPGEASRESPARV